VTRIVVTPLAQADMERLCDFLEQSLPHEAARTAGILADGLAILRRHAEIGRPIGDGLRELVISRGRTDYVALYQYDDDLDVVSLLRVRHQRESGYEH
jgi:addiction module RelE/StbE family toxin